MTKSKDNNFPNFKKTSPSSCLSRIEAKHIQAAWFISDSSNKMLALNNLQRWGNSNLQTLDDRNMKIIYKMKGEICDKLHPYRKSSEPMKVLRHGTHQTYIYPQGGNFSSRKWYTFMKQLEVKKCYHLLTLISIIYGI